MSTATIDLPLRQGGVTRQRGAALVIGLVLMMVLTVLGISAMSTATLELTLASNMQAQQDAFQAAETGIDIAIARRNWTTVAPSLVAQTPLGDGTYATHAITTNAACTMYPDGAFSAGIGMGAYHFDIVATGTGSRGANSTNKQSFYVAGPGC